MPPSHRFRPAPARALHPVHAALLAGSLPLFAGTLLSDWAYAASYEVQWTNFASWLNAGALLFLGLALVFALVDTIRGLGRGIIYLVLVAATFAIGLVNSFIHAKDGWASMPTGLVLSILVTGLALVAVWFGFATLRKGEAA
ncbi:DUF2231 domain-containing protein [Novosphingobium sp. BW1]|uniref:DUF2231 domain-containing protein n=1 Tax=Novosphingobium sp. BW1 TaxID=2592621 RepID=UPI0011DEE690|nr:DUF2231 domain-containing protein [Novosphingobium sp. BW1]TYC92901.1 hypothetical protein FMM79_02540 [Novosphingobium sp. BW1]